MTPEEKLKAHAILSKHLKEQLEEVTTIEPRLGMYLSDLVANPKHHNAYEILGAVKFLRLLRTYETDIETFNDVVYKYEGEWTECDGVWKHVDGGLMHPGTTGPTYYRLQPFQVFVLASMFLFKVWIDTEAQEGSRELLSTEKVMEV